MTWRLSTDSMHRNTPDGSGMAVVAEWSDSQIQEAAEKIKSAFDSDLYLNDPEAFNHNAIYERLKDFLPAPLRDAL